MKNFIQLYAFILLCYPLTFAFAGKSALFPTGFEGTRKSVVNSDVVEDKTFEELKAEIKSKDLSAEQVVKGLRDLSDVEKRKAIDFGLLKWDAPGRMAPMGPTDLKVTLDKGFRKEYEVSEVKIDEIKGKVTCKDSFKKPPSKGIRGNPLYPLV